MAIASNGAAGCVTASPAAQKVIDDTLRRLGVLDSNGTIVKVLGLPFTGADLLGVAIAAAWAVGIGTGMGGIGGARRARRPKVQLMEA